MLWEKLPKSHDKVETIRRGKELGPVVQSAIIRFPFMSFPGILKFFMGLDTLKIMLQWMYLFIYLMFHSPSTINTTRAKNTTGFFISGSNAAPSTVPGTQ